MPPIVRRLLLRLARALVRRATTAQLRDKLPEVFEILDPRLRSEIRLNQPAYSVEELMRSAASAVISKAATTEDVEALSMLFDPRKILGL